MQATAPMVRMMELDFRMQGSQSYDDEVALSEDYAAS